MEAEPNAQYWGIFAEIHAGENVGVEEMQSYEGVFAVLADLGFGAISDVDDYLELADRLKGDVLELGCGSGRVLLRLAERGAQVTGLDNSEDMLKLLRERLRGMPEAAQQRVTLVQEDARDFSLDRKYSLVILPCCTLALFPTRKERLAVLQGAAKHLAVGGVLAFSYPAFHSGELDRLDGAIERTQFAYEGCPADARIGFRVMRENGCLLGNAYIEISRPNGEVRRCLESKQVMLLDPAELDELLQDAGLNVMQSKRAPLPDGLGELVTLACTPRPAGDYPLWHPYLCSPQPHVDLLMLVEGHGSKVRDQHGGTYIDASGGLWNLQCGHGNPTIIAAINKQLERLSYGTLFAGRTNETALALARKLTRIAPAPLPWVYLTNSGSESVELSIKLARMHHRLRGEPQKQEIVFLDQSYHGTFFGSLSVSGLYHGKELFAPTLSGVSAISTPDPERRPAGIAESAFMLKCADELEQRIRDTQEGVAAFLAEPVLGSAGMIAPPKEYFDRIQEICRDNGVLFVVDEVATGFGRTGRWFACEHFGLRPDVLLLSKGINSGYLPLGAVLFSAAIGQTLLHNGAHLGHGSSHNGNPACAAAALATIDVIGREALVERAAASGDYLRTRMEELTRYASVKAIRGLGLMLAIRLQQSDGAAATPLQVSALLAALQHRGLLCYPGPSSLAFIPPLVISREELNEIMDALHLVLGALWLQDGRVGERHRR